MEQIGKLAKAMQVLIVSLLVSIALVQGVYGIQVTASGGSGGESGSVALNFDLVKDATANSELVIEGADIAPTTTITGPVSKFEQSHGVEDSSGKSAGVSVKVVNAPNGLTYESYVLPGEGSVSVQPWVSAEQWLTVPRADSIQASASAHYGTLYAFTQIAEDKGSSSADFVTLTDYHGKGYASATQVDALQTAKEASGKSIEIYGDAIDGSFSDASWVAGSATNIQGLDASSSAGTSTQAALKGHIKGGFVSKAGTGTQTRTRTPNYGTEHDIDMLAAKGSSPTGILGYYIDINNPAANKIQDAVNAATAGDIVNVASGKYLENVQIDKSLSVKGAGKGNTIVDGKKAGSVFTVGKVSPSVDVTLSGMTIQNGVTGYGAGIYNMGRTTVKDSTVSGNTANYEGGAILNKGQLTIQGASEISGNTAQNGGGIVNYGTLKLDGSKISGNTAYSNGGGILNGGTMTMTGSTISGNSAASGGGIGNFGITSSDGTYVRAKAVITSSLITGNHASLLGGGIDSDGTISITGSTITGNDARWAAGMYNDWFATISQSTFSGNTASEYGGGVHNDHEMSITDSTITGNRALAGQAGGIGNFGTLYNDAGKSDVNGNHYVRAHLTVSGTTISNNEAYAHGGGIASDGNAEITGCTITGNKASIGAGVYNDAGSMTLTGNSIYGNTASVSGGGIYNYGTATINDGSISGNIATIDGGGIFNGKTLSVGGTTQITNNEAVTGRGGGIYSYSGPVTLQGTDIDIKANKAHLETSQSSWYKGWGVYSYIGTPAITSGFDPAKQATGNARV